MPSRLADHAVSEAVQNILFSGKLHHTSECRLYEAHDETRLLYETHLLWEAHNGRTKGWGKKNTNGKRAKGHNELMREGTKEQNSHCQEIFISRIFVLHFVILRKYAVIWRRLVGFKYREIIFSK